jgi:hypothetical protein
MPAGEAAAAGRQGRRMDGGGTLPVPLDSEAAGIARRAFPIEIGRAPPSRGEGRLRHRRDHTAA